MLYTLKDIGYETHERDTSIEERIMGIETIAVSSEWIKHVGEFYSGGRLTHEAIRELMRKQKNDGEALAILIAWRKGNSQRLAHRIKHYRNVLAEDGRLFGNGHYDIGDNAYDAILNRLDYTNCLARYAVTPTQYAKSIIEIIDGIRHWHADRHEYPTELSDFQLGGKYWLFGHKFTLDEVQSAAEQIIEDNK